MRQELVDIYQMGYSVTEVAEMTEIPVSTVRWNIKQAGALRTRTEGVQLAAAKGKLNRGPDKVPGGRANADR